MRWSLVVQSACAAGVVCALAAPARAQDEFEIQVYDVETAHQGEPGLERVEGYGAFGPVDALGDDENVERAFGVVDVRGGTWDLDAGVGVSHGNGDDPVAKLIFGMHPRA